MPCPGIHRQKDALSLNSGEYPATANTLSGYVFRVENQGTVHYLQGVGRTGHLTTVLVDEDTTASRFWEPIIGICKPSRALLLYLLGISATLASLALMVLFEAFWGLGILLILMAARLLNVCITRRRAEAGWHGMKEPGVKGELLVLLSQDRWVRIKGLTDHLKVVIPGQWLRDATFVEECLDRVATVIVYLAAVLGSNATQVGKIILVVLRLTNVGLLKLSNNYADSLHMKGMVLKVDGDPKKYERRLDLANELVKETGRNDWAYKMGMVPTESSSGKGVPVQTGEVHV